MDPSQVRQCSRSAGSSRPGPGTPGGTRTRTRALLRRLPLPLGYGGAAGTDLWVPGQPVRRGLVPADGPGTRGAPACAAPPNGPTIRPCPALHAPSAAPPEGFLPSVRWAKPLMRRASPTPSAACWTPSGTWPGTVLSPATSRPCCGSPASPGAPPRRTRRPGWPPAGAPRPRRRPLADGPGGAVRPAGLPRDGGAPRRGVGAGGHACGDADGAARPWCCRATSTSSPPGTRHLAGGPVPPRAARSDGRDVLVARGACDMKGGLVSVLGGARRAARGRGPARGPGRGAQRRERGGRRPRRLRHHRPRAHRRRVRDPRADRPARRDGRRRRADLPARGAGPGGARSSRAEG